MGFILYIASWKFFWFNLLCSILFCHVHWKKLLRYQVIPVLDAQRLMGPKVVSAFSAKNFWVYCARQFYCVAKTPDHKKHHWSENQNRKIGEELWRKIFKNFIQKPPGKNIQGAPKTQDRKIWLPGWNSHWIIQQVGLRVSIALASGLYSFMETKNLPTCVD